MTRTHKFIYNTLTSALLQVITMLAGFVIPRIMLVYYGSEINGLVSSITQIISYFSLVEAGLSSAAVYALYKPLAADDHTAISQVVVAAKEFYIKAGLIFSALSIVLAVAYPFYLQTEVLSKADIALLVVALAGKGVLDFFSLAKYRVLLTADQKVYVVSIASMIYQVLNTVAIIIMSYYGASIVLVKYLALSPLIIRSTILYLYCRKRYPYLNFNETPNKQALKKRWDALILQILGVIHTGAPVVILAVVLRDLVYVSIYSVYNMVVVGLTGVLSIFTSGLSASFGDVIARKEAETLKNSYSEFELSYYLLISAAFSTAIVMISSFVKIYTGDISDANYMLPGFGILTMVNALLYCVKTPQGMLVISAGMYKETKIQTTIQGAIVVILGICLSLPWGIYGVVIASILSNLYRDVDLLCFVPKRITGLPIKNSARRMIRCVLCVSISSIFCMQFHFEPAGYAEWVLYATITGVISFVFIAIVNLIFEKNLCLSVMHRICQIVRKAK